MQTKKTDTKETTKKVPKWEMPPLPVKTQEEIDAEEEAEARHWERVAEREPLHGLLGGEGELH